LTVEVIEEFWKHPELWKVKSSGYFNQYKWEEAWERLTKVKYLQTHRHPVQQILTLYCHSRYSTKHVLFQFPLLYFYFRCAVWKFWTSQLTK
jgi:hypothetical protein